MYHAQIYWEDAESEFKIKDMNSLNGTWVGHKDQQSSTIQLRMVLDEQTLSNSDYILIGSTTLQFFDH